jgi:hypothetical protein
MAVSKRTGSPKTARKRPENPSSALAHQALADGLCPPRTDGVERSLLVPSTGRELTPDQARARAIPAVEAVVAEACRWGTPGDDWTVGDHRFLILEFFPAKGEGLYVQLWTEPDDPVLVEVCSGAWTPPARKYVRAPQRVALRALGYQVGGRARNFQKRWPVAGQRHASALATELVGILVDVFGYRGRQPLVMKYFAGGRTSREAVFSGVVVDDVKRMLGMAGMRVQASGARRLAEVAASHGSSPHASGENSSIRSAIPREIEPRLLEVDKPFPFLIEMVLRAKADRQTYNGLRLISVIDDGAGFSDSDIVNINSRMPCGRIQSDSDGHVMFVLEVAVNGVTVEWFVSMMRNWQELRRHAVRVARGVHRARQASVVPGGEADDSDPDLFDIGDRPPQKARTVVH